MIKIKKFITNNVDLILAVALVLFGISELPVRDSLKDIMLYIKSFSNIVITIILVILYILMRKKADSLGTKIVAALLFINALVWSLLAAYRSFIEILNK